MRGRTKKKGVVGVAAAYITRNKALKKLRISLKDFRRLCILKGIYPRDPKKKPKGHNKTYYHVKDIQFLMHEPLLNKFRELKTYIKKVRRYQSRQAYDRVAKLKEHKPVEDITHLVTERYPTFIDAVRDMDDALGMVFLFTHLPTKIRRNMTSERSALCERLAREFRYFVYKTKALQHVFVSVKGYYYQAQVAGNKVTWLVPHAFTQNVPKDLDYGVMLTFLQFYETFLRFVLAKLFHDQGWVYPPVLDVQSLENRKTLNTLLSVRKLNEDAAAAPGSSSSGASAGAAGLDPEAAAKARVLQAKLDGAVQKLIAQKRAAKAQQQQMQDDQDDQQQASAAEDDDEEDEETAAARAADNPASTVFAGQLFVLSRETAQSQLEFVLLCGGGRVRQLQAGESAKIALKSGAQYFVCDRPRLPAELKGAAIVSVQPQWVFDSFNARVLLPAEPYGVGRVCPPHLSPYVNDLEEGYIPRQRHVLQKWGAQDSVTQAVAGSGQAPADGELQDPAEAAPVLKADPFAKKSKKKQQQQEQQEAAAMQDDEEDGEEEEDSEDDEGDIDYDSDEPEDEDAQLRDDDEDFVPDSEDDEGEVDSEEEVPASVAKKQQKAVAGRKRKQADPGYTPSKAELRAAAQEAQEDLVADPEPAAGKRGRKKARDAGYTPSKAELKAAAEEDQKDVVEQPKLRRSGRRLSSSSDARSSYTPSKAELSEAAQEEHEDAEILEQQLQKKKPAAASSFKIGAGVGLEEDAENEELRKIMMSKKKRRLYDRMSHGIQRKADAVDELHRKRQAADAEKQQPKKPAAGKKGSRK